MKFPKPVYYVKIPPDETWEFLANIDWFSSLNLLSNKELIISSAASTTWEDFTLERRNDITASLAKNHKNKETEWNKVAVAYRNYFKEKIFPNIKSKAEIFGLQEDVLELVSWCVISYMMEVTYDTWRIPKFFFRVIDSYKSGNLPHGWEGKYPDGKLLEI
ncbi:MAG: hypothetical protein AB3N63_09385 [Puniceicoccaceae bacterium]